MSRAETKSARLAAIANLLMSHPEGLTQSEVARRMGVHRSTILRDLPDLTDLYHIIQEGSRLFLDPTSDLISLQLNIHEALALHLSARLLATRMDRQNPHAAAALRKIGASMEHWAGRLSRHILEAADALDEMAQRQDPIYLQALETITLGWAELRRVRIWHRSDRTGQVTQYLFSPYFIEPYAVGQTTMLIGYADPPGALRTLKIERIEKVESTDLPYTIPEQFDARQQLSDAWGIWYSENDPTEVTLRFSRRVAHRVQETRWHRSQKITLQSDGSLIWQARVAELQEMLPWVRAWGADCEVLSPDQLRKTLINEARALAENYGLHVSTEPGGRSTTIDDFFGG